MDTIPATSPRWIDTAEVAKLVRKALKREFPTVKFSVRSSRYSGGSSVSIGWTDGPTDPQVTRFVHGFQGSRFDSMIDLQYCADSWYCDTHGAQSARTYGHSYDSENQPTNSRCCHQAELVHMGSSHVSTQRTLSDELRAELEAKVLVRNPGLDKRDYGFSYELQQLINATAR